MKKETVLTLLSGVSLMFVALAANAQDPNQPADPMSAYYYNAPANSWYAAKIKPKLKMQMQAKTPAVATVPAATGAPENTPVARSVDPPKALPFWVDIPAK
jgi:hypothetical protein